MLAYTMNRTYVLMERAVEVEELGPVHSGDIVTAPAGNVASNSQNPQIPARMVIWRRATETPGASGHPGPTALLYFPVLWTEIGLTSGSSVSDAVWSLLTEYDRYQECTGSRTPT